MFIVEMFEDSGKRFVVTYPGRFQPFHKGHADVFHELQSRFGSDNVFIVTTDKTNNTDSPFSFSDKVRFMHAAGIPDHSIIQATKPYDLPDVFQSQKENIIFIAALGEQDASRMNPGGIKKDGSPTYFQKMPEHLHDAESADQHGYVLHAEERANETVTINGKAHNVSHGTQCRELWNLVRDNPQQRAEFIKQLYGRADSDLGHILDKIPTEAPEPKPTKSPRMSKAGSVPAGPKLKPVKEPKPIKEPKAPKVINPQPEEPEEIGEGLVLTKDQKMDIWLAGRGKTPSQDIRRKVAADIPLSKVEAYIAKVAQKFKLNPKAFVYGPSAMSESVGDKHTDPAPSMEFVSNKFYVKFTAGGIEFYRNGDLVHTKPGDYSNPTRGDYGVAKGITSRLWQKEHDQVKEEAAGVGVVKNGKDPRYMTATMGNDNDVNAGTLNNMMRGYKLTGRKVPSKIKEQRMAAIIKEMELVKSKIAKYKTIQETTSAGAIATSMGDGNGFGQSIFYKRSQPLKKAKKK